MRARTRESGDGLGDRGTGSARAEGAAGVPAADEEASRSVATRARGTMPEVNATECAVAGYSTASVGKGEKPGQSAKGEKIYEHD